MAVTSPNCNFKINVQDQISAKLHIRLELQRGSYRKQLINRWLGEVERGEDKVANN
jgi:hypothetical protein